MTRRWLLLIAALAVAAALIAFLLSTKVRRRSAEHGAVTGDTLRIVSLAPAITETLFVIGAGSSVVGVSDYCDRPPVVRTLPKVGSGITPNYEALARLRPTLILTEQTRSTQLERLRAIAPARALPWLSLQQVAAGIAEIGRLTGKEQRAQTLAAELRQKLSRMPPPDAPRVLLVLGYTPGHLSEIWYVRDDSLHGAALRASGGKNAIDRAPAGAPRLSLDELIRIDPDMIVILPGAKVSAATRSAYLGDFAKLDPLNAVKTGRISVLESAEPFASGPTILEFLERLAAELARLRNRPPP
jgi:iron complex transport system substrate-binding protein